MNDDFIPESAVYTPPEFASYGIEAINRSKDTATRGLSLGIGDRLDDYFAPVGPGQVCAVIAQTSQYKSGFFHAIEHSMAYQLKLAKRTDEVIIHVSVEESIEEQAFLEFARLSQENAGQLARGQVQDWDRLMQAATIVAGIPIFRIGESLARAEDMPNLYLSNMIRSIKTLIEGDILDWKAKPAAIFFDYLQAFPIDPETKTARHDNQRRLQVRSDIYRLRQAAAYFKCPVFVAVQAKQNLSGAAPPIMLPGIYDGEESSSIAQRSDRVLTLWMPKMTHPVGTTIEKGRIRFDVRDNHLFVKVAKQRGGLPSGQVFPCWIDFRTNTITPMQGVFYNSESDLGG